MPSEAKMHVHRVWGSRNPYETDFYRIKKSYMASMKKIERIFEENTWAQIEHLE